MNCPTCQTAECSCGWKPNPPAGTPPTPDPNPAPMPLSPVGGAAGPPPPEPVQSGGGAVPGVKAKTSALPASDGEKAAAAAQPHEGNKPLEPEEKRENQAKSAPAGNGNDVRPAKGKKGKDLNFPVMRSEKKKKSGFGGVVVNRSGKLEVERVDSGQAAFGDGNNLFAFNFGGDNPEGRKAEKKSYLEVINKLHLSTDSKQHKFEADEVAPHLHQLEDCRLLVVNCLDDDLANASVAALVERLDAGDLQKFYLDCDRAGVEETELRIELFTGPEDEAETPAVVYVDASGKRGTLFMESLLGVKQTAEELKQDLRANNLWLICRGDYSHARKPMTEARKSFYFPCWDIDWLHELLKRHFPEGHQALKERIEKQRAQDRWVKDDGAFWSQIRGLVENGRLEAEVKEREQDEGALKAEEDARASFVRSHFKGGDSIKDTVLYVAANFPDLNPHEFNRVVSALLEGLTTKVAVLAPKAEGDVRKAEATAEKERAQNHTGDREPEFVWEERALQQMWLDGADELLAECRLEVVTGKESGRRIDFKDPTLRQYLRDYLETEKGFYLKKQFGRIQRLGLLFDRSVNVNEGVIGVTVRMALESPETFGRDWLFDIVTALSPLLEVAAGEAEGRDDDAYRPALPADLAAAMRVVYSTVARLVRRMLEHTHLEKTINDLFARLMASSQHEAVLEIVRRLQTTQQFELRWVRQLFDQGGETIQFRTYSALYERVRQRDAGIYEVLQVLESWLPEREREPYFYSPSNQYAMRLIFEYSLLTTAEFDSKFYGSWPCRYPLLATPGLDTAEGARATNTNLSLLTNWLFHPGLSEVVTDDTDENINVSLGALLAEWAVILLGRDVAAGEGSAQGVGGVHISGQSAVNIHHSGYAAAVTHKAAGAPNGDSARDARPRPETEAVFDLLLRKVIAVTTPAQQKELIACWDDLADYFLLLVNTPGLQSGGPRRRLSRRRNWVRYLIKRFKILRRQAA
ncbi:MAG: hypothetical protein ABW208_03805 [Pyrinomonadaceae bacterium]